MQNCLNFCADSRVFNDCVFKEISRLVNAFLHLCCCIFKLRVRHCTDTERICNVAYSTCCPSVCWKVGNGVANSIDEFVLEIFCNAQLWIDICSRHCLKTVRIQDCHDVVQGFSNDVVFCFKFKHKPCFCLCYEIFCVGGGSEFGFNPDGFSAAFNYECIKFTVALDKGMYSRFDFPSVTHASQDVDQVICNCRFVLVWHNVFLELFSIVWIR